MSSLTGHLDYINSGFISGWVLLEDNTRPLLLEVNGVISHQLFANEFRQDIFDEGLGDGYCGFKSEINDINIKTSDTLNIRILNENREVVPSLTAKVLGSELGYRLELLETRNLQILFKVNSDIDKEGESFRLFSGTKQVLVISKDIPKGVSTLSIPIPALLINDQTIQLTLGVSSFPLALWRGEERFNNVTTPWQYLKSGSTEPGLIGSCAQAKYRYESLKLGVKSNQNELEVSDKISAHDVLVEGWEGRTKFPNLKLPYFDAPKVSIIIPAYNKFEISYHTIASIILAPTNVSYEVILADDCSDDDTLQAAEIIENLVVIRNKENLMFLRSCNNAATKAKGEYIVFLNNDTEVTANWLDELIEPMKKDPLVGLTGSKLLNGDGSLQEAGGIVWDNGKPWNIGNGDNPKSPEYNYCREVDYLSGASLCISKNVWKEVGGFSEYLTPAYFEDTDIAFKVRSVGYKTVYTPHSEVFHFEGMSHGTDLTSGVKKYQVVNSSKFAARWIKELKYNGKEGQDLQLNKDRNIDKRILVFDYTTPSPNEDAGSYAAIQEIKLLQGLGFKVTFVPQNIAHLGKLTKQLQKMGVEVLFGPFYSSLEMIVNQRLNEMDAVYITRYTVAEVVLPIIKRVNSSIPVLFNNADLHFLREIRAALNTKDEVALSTAKVTMEKELNVMKQVDAILSYNETEHAVITSHIFEQDKVHRCPWVLEEKSAGPEFSKRDGIAFLGGYNHLPNVEAVEFLIEKVMPLLAQNAPQIKLYVYGSNMPEEFNELACDNVEFVGYAENLDDVYHQHKIFVAPLLSGAGIKGKVLEAMAYSTPCVLTNVAAEGTGLTNEISALFAETPEAWGAQIVKLYDDKKLWNKLSDSQSAIVKQRFTYEVSLEQMRKVLTSVGVYC